MKSGWVLLQLLKGQLRQAQKWREKLFKSCLQLAFYQQKNFTQMSSILCKAILCFQEFLYANLLSSRRRCFVQQNSTYYREKMSSSFSLEDLQLGYFNVLMILFDSSLYYPSMFTNPSYQNTNNFNWESFSYGMKPFQTLLELKAFFRIQKNIINENFIKQNSKIIGREFLIKIILSNASLSKIERQSIISFDSDFYIHSQMKKKQFDAFSFKAPQQSEQSIGEISSKEEIPPSIQIPRDIKYRHLEYKPPTIIFDRQINKKISTINEQIDINVKRRMELEQKLSILQKLDREKQQREMFATYSANKYKEQEQIVANFSKMNLEADKIESIITKQSRNMGKSHLEKSKEILLSFDENMDGRERILIPIIQHMSSKKSKPIPVYTVPDQAKLQGYLRKITFPQIPSGNLLQLKKELEQLAALYSPHSDIHYLLMVVCYHLKNWQGVRKHYSEICNFKTYNLKSHWIAAQTEFEEKNYDLCLKQTEQCINLVAQQFLPRFVYLKARCYEGIGNYVNSLVCYNQLIRMRPNITDYYLERGILYHRLGYYPQAKQDFVAFGVMRPDAQMVLKEKILAEKSEHKKKEYIAVLAKMF